MKRDRENKVLIFAKFRTIVIGSKNITFTLM